jgi:hypothetical protein
VPSPEVARQLVDLGGWTVCVFLVITIFVGLFREWWVPGWLYRREREARETADIQAERNAAAIAALAKWVNRERRRPLSAQEPRDDA